MTHHFHTHFFLEVGHGRGNNYMMNVSVREANFYLTHPFFDLVSGQSSSWQTAHVRVGGVV